MKTQLFRISLLIIFAIISNISYSQSTTMVKDISTDINSGIQNLITYKNKVYFTHSDGGYLWSTDGTETGTQKVKDSNDNEFTWIKNLIIMNNELFFTVTNSSNNNDELWKTDGTQGGTVMVKDLFTSDYKNPSAFFATDNLLYFMVFEIGIGNKLIKSDGTTNGTEWVQGIGQYRSIEPKATMGDYLYFNAEKVTGSSTTGRELCKTNGANASVVKDISPGYIPNTTMPMSSDPDKFQKIGNVLFFVASETFERELWKTDGTNAGTVLVKDISGVGFGSYLDHLTLFDNQLYFVGANTTDGVELWKSDGTSTGTVMVKDINNDPGSSSISGLFDYNGTLIFVADDAINGRELWKSDGTEAGTILLKNINTTAGQHSDPDGFTINKNEVYFSAYRSFSEGVELWKTDGTTAGTVLVEDINSSNNSNPQDLQSIGKLLIFSANDGTGSEIWKHNPCNLVPETKTVTIEIDDSFVSISMPSGALATTEGTHQDTLRISNGCDSIISTYILTNSTDINTIAFGYISIFPNPTTGIVNISVNETLTSIVLLDLTGKIVKEFNSNSRQLDVSNINAGIYFLEIANAEKKSIIKIIKK